MMAASSWFAAAMLTGLGVAAQGASQGTGSTFTHPRGWFSFQLPPGWTVGQQGDDSLVINPGLSSSDTLDALVIVSYGAIEAPAAGSDVVALFTSMAPGLVQDLASQSIVVADPAIAPARVAVRNGDGDGIIQQWTGKAAGRDVLVWIGGLAVRDHYLAVIAVLVAGQETRFVPGLTTLLQSVTARPPERNPAVEAALRGARFSASDTRPGGSRGSFSVIFEFRDGQRLRKTMMMSGLAGLYGVGGDSEEWGTYEVAGGEVRIAIGSERDVLTLVVEEGRIVALRRGDRVYRRR